MKEKINIAELLKDCPSGMELDCTMWDDVLFDHVDMTKDYPIYIRRKDGMTELLTKNGEWNFCLGAKCVIFPKGKTTWDGFQRPFKDGDVVFYNDTIAIFKEWGDETLFRTYVTKYLCCDSLIDTNVPLFGKGVCKEIRLATEEEKQKLFDAIKANSYKWDAETKTLDKLIEPKFKVGDKIKKKGDTRLITISDVRDNCYIIKIPDYFGHCCITDKLSFSNQNNYELVPQKFDISTLKPFNKVLVRGDVGQKWTHDFFGFIDKDKGCPFVCVGHYVIQCIPFEGNEHLLGTTNDCDEYYKTWGNEHHRHRT